MERIVDSSEKLRKKKYYYEHREKILEKKRATRMLAKMEAGTEVPRMTSDEKTEHKLNTIQLLNSYMIELKQTERDRAKEDILLAKIDESRAACEQRRAIYSQNIATLLEKIDIESKKLQMS